MSIASAREREAAATIPVYGQYDFVPAYGEGCEIVTTDGRRILDMYGGHAVAALGYGDNALNAAIADQARSMIFQSNAVALDIRAAAAELLVSIAPQTLDHAFFVNSGAEANENALRIACMATGRARVLAVTHGFHGRTAAAAAVTWNAGWYGFPNKPFEVEFIPRDDIGAAERMIDDTVAAVIFEPVQGIAGAYDLDNGFVQALRQHTTEHGAVLIADEVQCGMGRSGAFFASETYDIIPDLLTSAKSLGGGFPCGAVLASDELSENLKRGDLGSTFGGGPLACAAIIAVINAVKNRALLQNVREREAQVRETCITGPVTGIQGKGMLLGLQCDRPASEVQRALLERDILTGSSAATDVVRLLPPLVLEHQHVERLANALADINNE